METAAKLNNSGIALTEANRPYEAISLFQEAIIMEPENPMLWLNLGIAQQKTGDYTEAIESFRHSLIIDDDLPEPWQSMGLIYYETKEFELAEKCFFSALSRNENDPKTWNNLGVLYFNKNDLKEARICFEKSISLWPHFYDALYNLRDTCRELGYYRAAAEFERVLSNIDPFKNIEPPGNKNEKTE
jgi:tetratricopeptide (TPR) repeat protein